jgi:hypothetical protein
MKLNRLIAASVVGISLLTTSTSVFAENNGSSYSLFGIFTHPDTDKASKRQSDMNGQDTGRGRNCGTSTQTPPPPPPPPVGPKG